MTLPIESPGDPSAPPSGGLQHLQAPASLLARVKMALAAERSRPD